MASNKLRLAEGVTRSADGILVDFKQLTVDPGWNVRARTPELEAHIESIKDSILGGGTIPPLSVYVNDKGKIVLVDGHCRREGIERARKAGAEYEKVLVVEFTGNDADRIAAMFTSAQGKALTPYEQAVAFKRLQALNWTPTDIAKRVGRTLPYVSDMLKLANSNEDVHALVRTGQVSVDAAVKTVKKSGGAAGAILKEKVEAVNKGTAPGQKRVKVTAKHVDAEFVSQPMQRVLVEYFTTLENHLTPEVYADITALAKKMEDNDLGDEDVANLTIEVPKLSLLHMVRIQQSLKG